MFFMMYVLDAKGKFAAHERNPATFASYTKSPCKSHGYDDAVPCWPDAENPCEFGGLATSSVRRATS